MHLADAFIQSDLQLHSGYTFLNQYVCSLGIEPTTFCAADEMLYLWAIQEHIRLLLSVWPKITEILRASERTVSLSCSKRASTLHTNTSIAHISLG